MNTMSKPYTVPADHAPDETYIRCYWWLIARDPKWLASLRREDGSLYLERDMICDASARTLNFQVRSLHSAGRICLAQLYPSAVCRVLAKHDVG